MTSHPRPIIALSGCLAGERVRYDGTHRRDRWLLEQLGRHVEFRSYCPEVAIGLGVPRQPIRLLECEGVTRVVGVDDPTRDVTEALRGYAEQVAAGLEDVSGYVFKSRSPSCGLRVGRYDASGRRVGHVRGAFAEVIVERLPDLPVEEEGRLDDPLLRENFVARIFVYRRWQDLLAGGLEARALSDFHARHKYLLMAHSQAAYKRLGRLLSQLKGADLRQLADTYRHGLMAALRRQVTPARHVNVLQHIQGYLKGRIGAGERQELAAAIEAYRQGEVPLLVPLRVLQHQFRQHPDDYIAGQVYLDPYPVSLGLRSHV